MTSLIGQNILRTDGEAKVRGDAVYGVDYKEAGMLYGGLLRSPVPAGRIVEFDTGKAESMPGVRAVCTAANSPQVRGGWVIKDQVLFAGDTVRYEGEPIAAVAADTLEQAMAAVEAIELEIEPLEPIDLESARDPDARVIHPEWESYEPVLPEDFPRHGNVACEVNLEQGDVDAAFERADLVVEDEFTAPRQYQAYMEPKSAVARYENGRCVVHTAHQFPFNVRTRVAQFLDARPSDVRVVGLTVGGGFGGKLDASLEPYAAILARETKRPVKIVNNRQEDLLTATARENATYRIRSAVTNDGEILGREITCYMDNGAYSGEMPLLASLPALLGGTVYRVGSIRAHVELLYTNSAPTGAFRGVAGAHLLFALERHIDNIANQLGIDRREFRYKNIYDAGDQFPTEQPLPDAVPFREALDELEKRAPWAEASERKPYRGVGLAAIQWVTNPLPGSATLKLNEDGTIGVITGATEIGTGAVATGITQIVAEELGVRPEDVVVMPPDTDAAGYDSGAQGSRTTHIVGAAARKASTEVRRQIFRTASDLLEAAEGDLELAEGHVRVAGSPESRVPLATVAGAATMTTGTIMASGNHATPPPAFNPNCATGLLFPIWPTMTFHVHMAEVEVDPDTGKVTILRYLVAQDVGRAINPLAIKGQIQGGVAQGIGYALYEDVRIEDGRYLERNLESYRLPVAKDVPTVETVLLEHPDELGPFGAKGVAEPPIIPVAAAVANAVSDAIGKPINKLPITPWDVLAALDERSG